MTIKRNIPAAALVLVALAATAVAAVAQGGESSPGTGVEQVTSIDGRARAAMRVLDAPRGAGDALPSGIAAHLDGRAQFGMNPELSRKAIDTIANDVYVIPADGRVCFALTVGDGATVGCPSTDEVVDGTAAAATVTLEGGSIGIAGIVPDGVDSVTVGTGVSASQEVEVTGNAYFAALPQGTPLRTVGYDGPSGVVEFTVHDPAALPEEQ